MAQDTAPGAGPCRQVSAPELGRVAAGMLLLAAAATYPLVTRMGSVLPGGLGDPLFGAFVLAWDADRLRHGLQGLWDAPFYFPLRDSLAYAEHLLGIAVFTAPVQWITGNAALAYNLAFLGSVVLAGVGMYLLAASLWGRRDAAWVAAVAFAFAPHRVMHAAHIQVLMSGWMPIGLWALHRYFLTRSRRALVAFAAAFIVLALSNGYFLFFFAVPVVVISAPEVWRVLAGRGSERSGRLEASGRLLLELGAAAAAIGIAIAPVAAAYVSVRQRMGLKRTAEEIESLSAQLGDYLRLPGHLPAWDAVLAQGLGERMLFPGLLVVVLAALGLVSAWRRPSSLAGKTDHPGWTSYVALYGAILGLTVWLSLGPARPGPYRLLLAVMPGMDGLRVPARFIVVTSLALAVLAGAGAASILACLRRRAAVTVAAILAFVICVEGYPGPAQLTIFNPAQRARSALNAWIREGPPGGVLELPVDDIAPFTLVYQYNTLLHGRPIVNGYSGYGYALQSFLSGPSSPLRELAQIPDMLTGLRHIGVRTLVLHPSAYEEWMGYEPSPIIRLLDDAQGQVAEARTFPLARAWRLDPAAPLAEFKDTSWTRLDAGQLSLTASTSPGDIGKAFDGDPYTRWESGEAQRGGEWVRIVLDRERDLVAVRLQSPPRWAGDYPRHLVIEGEADDGTRSALFDGSVLPLLMNSMARDGRLPEMLVTLRPNRTRVLWLRQTGQARHAYWTVPEIALWERQPAGR